MAERGRPCLFNEKMKERIIKLAEQGFTDKEICKKLGISLAAYYTWKAKFSDLREAVRLSKSVADEMVEAAMFRLATGYSHPEEKIFCQFGQIYRAKTIKHYPPNAIAAAFWLKNRQPDRWREKDREDDNQAITHVVDVIPLKSFEQFCIDAGYPKPFQKQLEMREFAFSDTEPRMLLGARGYGKTDYVTILGVAYDIYLHGSSTSNLIVTKSKSRNTAIMQEIAMALTKNGCELEKENASCVRIKGLVGKDHSAEAITIKTSMRGRHPKRIIMDDPVTEEDVSEAMRNTVKTKYNEAMKLCANMVVIGQPAHAYDLYAELRPQLKKIELPYGSIPELDHDLEAQRLAGVDESSIQKSYFLKVIPEGQIPFEHIRFIDQFPAVGSSVAFIDPSHEGGDYTAISIIAAFGQGVAVVGNQWKKAWNHCLDDIKPMLEKYNVQRLCFETNALGSMPIELLRQAYPNVGIVGRRSNNSKHARILAAASFAHMIHLSKESGQGYIDHIVKYEYKAKHDDAPDSLATGLEWIGLVRGKE